MHNAEFRICRRCGNLTQVIHDAGIPMMCCGQKMETIEPSAGETGGEKHKPVVTVKGKTVHVSVGSVHHPMEDAHAIEWVYLQTAHGGQQRMLHPGDAPDVTFALGDDTPIAVYAYCNQHGLWKTDL